MNAMRLRRMALAAAWVCVVLGAGEAAWGQTAYLVADLTKGETGTAGSDPSSLFPAGHHVFFLAAPEEIANAPAPSQLWVSDGTPAGTQRLHESCPVDCSIALVGSLGDLAFFIDGDQLWRSDGSRPGTFPLTNYGPSNPRIFAVLGNVLYYLAWSADSSEQLWRSDGTVAGTFLVADLGAGLFLRQDLALAATGGKLFFYGPEPADVSSIDLWESDGTQQGTVRVSRLHQASLSQLTVLGSIVLFVVGPPAVKTPELWVSDGTGAGTRRITPFAPANGLKAAGGKAYFAADDGTHGPQMWSTDGTAAGTRQVTNGPSGLSVPDSPDQVEQLGGTLVWLGADKLWSAALGATGPAADLCGSNDCGAVGFPRRLFKLGPRVAFVGGIQRLDSNDYSLWTSDGTGGGTKPLRDICDVCFDQPPSAVLAGGNLYFQQLVHDGGLPFELWRTNGRLAGTSRFAVQRLGFNQPLALALLADQALYVAVDASSNAAPNELWASNGTTAGTRQLTDATDPLSSAPRALTAAGGQVYFYISNLSGTASAPWRSAGTSASTLPVPIAPVGGPIAAGDTVFYVVPSSSSQGTLDLWRTDASGAGTLLTGFAPPLSIQSWPLAEAGGRIFFVVDDAGGGGSVWTSDGTPQGTVQRFALPPTVGLIYSLSVIGSDFFFADDHEAWRSDGTTAGTVQLSHFGIPTPVLLDPQFVRLGAITYFIGWNDESSLTQLWQTDGTPAGTSEVQLGGGPFTDPSDLRIAGGALYFLADSPDGAGTSLWRTDGTAAGTVMLGQFRGTIANPNRPGGLTSLGSGFAFHADDGVHGIELWATDGTAAGTRLVKDVQQGSRGSEPHDLAAAGGRVFFAADDGIHGNELWESDGTDAGTRIVQDINPGPEPSNPSGMTAAGGLLYFSANDGLTGQELWALPLAGPSGCQPSATALCLSRGRFEVKAFWRDFQDGSGTGQTLPLTSDTGTFWFFSPNNLEVIVKVIDGRALNGYFWVFYGALSSVEYALTVTDTVTGLAQRYFNPLGDLSSAGDTTAFGPLSAAAVGAIGAAGKPGTPELHRAGAITRPPAPAAAGKSPASSVQAAKPAPVDAGAAVAVPAAAAEASGTCQASALQLCLNGGRFAVKASWTDFSGNSGAGMAVPLTDETGYFWFFNAGNVETVLKVIDGRSLNNHFWVFYGALSNVQYTLTVTDTVTGAVKTYTNPAGQFASVADTAAF